MRGASSNSLDKVSLDINGIINGKKIIKQKILDMKKLLIICVAALGACIGIVAQPEGKEIYIPRELRNNDFTQDSSKWSYSRMACTEDFVVFWERPYGADLSQAPDLEGHDMKVNLQNLLSKLQRFYTYYRDSLKFTLPGSKSEKYRMMAMINYSLEGTAYGGAYDNEIGALWITPSRLRDDNLNAVAHEVGHAFQSQIYCDGYKRGMNGSIYEMTSQWMLWQVNPRWMDDETYHWNDYRRQTYMRFLHPENRYHTAQVLEYWSENRGLGVIADLFRECKRSEDCAQVYMRTHDLTLQQMNDEMFDCARHIVAMDYKRIKNLVSKYAFQVNTPTQTDKNGWQCPVTEQTPQIWGFNAFKIPTEGRNKVRVDVESLVDPANGGIRYGLILVKGSGSIEYSPMMAQKKGKLTIPQDATSAYLVVMGAPATYQTIRQGRNESLPDGEQTFPFRFKVK